MKNAFNRKREVQEINLVKHPTNNKTFVPAHEQNRQPILTQLKLHDLACYFSAYQVDPGMVNDLEALLVRGFANDILNVRMEKFAHSKA